MGYLPDILSSSWNISEFYEEKNHLVRWICDNNVDWNVGVLIVILFSWPLLHVKVKYILYESKFDWGISYHFDVLNNFMLYRAKVL